MAPRESFQDELRRLTSMPILVGRVVTVVKRGRVWSGFCPFHHETSPSFYAYDHGYHCFGCGAHGDAISFVMRTEGVTRGQAIALLASAANVVVPKP